MTSDDVTLVKISNGTAGKPPQAGDILSYGMTSLYGHTSVVTGSNVDGSGNGTITIIEQNVTNPANGMETSEGHQLDRDLLDGHHRLAARQ